MDIWKRTFFHWTVECGSAETVKNVLTVLNRQTALKLTAMQDYSEKTAADLADSDLKRDYLYQAGSYINFYILEKQPTVLIFYTAKNRQRYESPDGHIADAEVEKDCVENYFKDRNIPYTVKKDPTATDIFSSISDAQADRDLSGLMVFIMSHGKAGIVQVEPDDKLKEPYVLISDVMAQMCHETLVGKPKVSFLFYLYRRQICSRAYDLYFGVLFL